MDQERIVYLFSYGTLQLASVQTSLFGRILEGLPDSMRGYRPTMIELTDRDVIAKSGTAFHPIVTRIAAARAPWINILRRWILPY